MVQEGREGRGQSISNTTEKGKEARNLFGPLVHLTKKTSKKALQVSVPGRKKRKRETRNAW